MAGVGPLLGKLPRELRDYIYLLAMPQPKAYQLEHYGGQQTYTAGGKVVTRKAVKEVAPKDHHRSKDHRGQAYSRKDKEWLDITSEVAIIYTNKQIYAESAPILYSTNHFQFDSPKTMVDFFAQINPEMKLHVRSMALSPFTNTISGGYRSFGNLIRADGLPEEYATLLSGATGIRNLEIDHFFLCGDDWRERTEVVFDMCHPLLESLQATSLEKNLIIKAEEVIKIVLPPLCKSCFYRPERHVCLKGRKFTSSLKLACTCPVRQGERRHAQIVALFGELIGAEFGPEATSTDESDHLDGLEATTADESVHSDGSKATTTDDSDHSDEDEAAE